MLNNLKDNLINEYFMDCTYKIVPPNNNNFKLMVLSGYNSTKNKTMLCLFALITNEKENTFLTLFSYLKEKFSFNQHNYMCNFALGQINALKKFFQMYNCIVAFFIFPKQFGIILKKAIYVELELMKKTLNYYLIFKFFVSLKEIRLKSFLKK